TGGAIGSLIGQILPLSTSERKILLACGEAAGMAATFGAPLAAVVLAIELLLFEFTTRAFIPLVVAASVAGGVPLGTLRPRTAVSSSPPRVRGPGEAALLRGPGPGLWAARRGHHPRTGAGRTALRAAPGWRVLAPDHRRCRLRAHRRVRPSVLGSGVRRHR